jgi:benzodiazapine receptor
MPHAKLTKKDILPLGLVIIVTQLTGILRTIFSFTNTPSWYGALLKPLWIPPNWVFGLVWFVLYTLMALSSYLIWKEYRATGDEKIRNLLKLYIVHLALNASWSLVFIGAHQIGIALAIIIIMLGMVAILISRFWRIRKTAALLLVPYLAWLAFATAMNTALFFLNR